MTAITSPALRYHGGKFRLSKWIISHFPPHRRYVEPFGGAASVLLQKSRAYSEVYNDLDGEIVNFFRVLRDPLLRAALIEQITLTPYARDEFEQAWQPVDDPVLRARNTAIRAQMGFGSGGATKNTTGFRRDSERFYGTSAHLWAAYPQTLTAIGQRFSGVIIENRPAIDVIQQHDCQNTLHYIDPPYLHGTRCMRNNVYRHEMTDADHADLLNAVKTLRGSVILSGYDHPLYSALLDSGWQVRKTKARAASQRGTAMREETIWINPRCGELIHDDAGLLFAS